MSKFVGFVVGVALVVVGIATGNPALAIQGGLLIVSNAILLLTMPKTPARMASEQSIQLGEQPRVLLVGETFTAGSLVDGFNHGGKYGTDWECLVIRLADHKCHSLVSFYVNDELVQYTGNGNYPQFDDHHFELYFRADTTNEPLPAVVTDHGPGWTSADVGESGCDVVVCYLADKPDAKHPAWPGGRPRFGFVVKGAFCYDPRLDDTVTGGAGDHRRDDPATWEWSENPIICRLKWVYGVYANDDVSDQGALLIGRGLTAEEAPPENAIAPANLCDGASPCGPPYAQIDREDVQFEGEVALSSNAQWFVRKTNGGDSHFEFWYLPTLSLISQTDVGEANSGTVSEFDVSQDGTAYYFGQYTVSLSVFSALWAVTRNGVTRYESDADWAWFAGPTRVLEVGGETLVFTGINPDYSTGEGHLSFAAFISSGGIGVARDFCMRGASSSVIDGVDGLFEPTGSSDEFTIRDLTGLGADIVVNTGHTRSKADLEAAIFHSSVYHHYVVATDNRVIIVDDRTTMTPGNIKTDIAFTSQTLNFPRKFPWVTSIWTNYTERSVEDMSVIRTVDPLDWVVEDSGPSPNLFDYVHQAFIVHPQFADHITVRFLGGPRYRVAGPVYSNQDFIDVEGMFAAAVAGNVITHEGSVELEPAQAKSVVATITDDDLISASSVSWNHQVLSEANQEWVNTVVARYVEPTQKWADHAAPPVRDYADVIADGKPREQSVALRLVRDQDQALRIAHITRALGRLWGRATITLGPRFIELEEGDWINWQSDRYFDGATIKFRIESYTIDEKWRITITLREITTAVYSDFCDFGDDGSTTPPPVFPPDIGEPDSGDWTLTATVLTSSNGNEIPALVIEGAVPDDESVEAIIVEYWKDDGVLDPVANPDDIPWVMVGRYSPSTTRIEITSLEGGETYYVALTYIVSGIAGDRLVLGPETVADIDVGGQVGGIIDGLTTKAPVRVATTANGTLSSAFENGDTIDGVTLATGDRILIKNQSTQSQNGIYVVAASGAPARSSDADTGAELVNAVVRVIEGTLNAGTMWRQTTPATITLGSSNIVWEPVSGGIFATAAEIRAGTVNSKPIAPDQLVLSAVPQTLTDAAPTAWDMSLGYNAKWTIGGNRTLSTPTNPKEGLTYILEAIQDATGTRLVTWPSAFDWGSAGTPILSTASGKVDVVSLFCYDASTPKFRAVFSKAAP